MTYWDRSLGVRVSRGGSKTFVVLAGSGKRRALGRYPEITLQQARQKAKLFVPNSVGDISFKDALDLFVKTHCAVKNRASTAKETERLLRKHFGSIASLDVTAKKISLVLDGLLSTPSEANHAFVAARTFFRWCERRGYITINPMRTLQMPHPKKRRKRILTDDELRAVWKATEQTEGHFGTIVKLLILTAQRRGEIGGLKGSYYSHNQQTICLPPELTKNHREHTFPTGTLVIELLKPHAETPGFIFPARGKPAHPFSGWSKSKIALDKLANIPHWTLHDLRRTVRTNLGRLKVPSDIAERLVNHVSARTEMEETYDLHTYLPEMRDAVQKWEDKLLSIVTP